MKKIYLLLIILLALLLRFIGFFWGKVYQDDFDKFQHDEYQHVEIAIDLIHQFDPSFMPDYEFTWPPFNARGLGGQIAMVAYPLNKLTPLKDRHLLIIGRLLSVLYSLMMIVLLYRMGQFFFKSENIGLLAALLYAVFDLTVTHGRYSIPAVTYGFWVYFAIFQIVRFFRSHTNGETSNAKVLVKHALLLGLGFGMALSVKYDYLAFLVFVLLLIYLCVCDAKNYLRFVSVLVLSVGIALLTFYTSTLFEFSIKEFIDSYSFLYKENQNVVAEDSHWLTNPLLYLFAVVAGSSLLVFVFFIIGFYGLVKQYRKHFLSSGSIELILLILLMGGEFVVRWALDTPFIRRANVFMPFVALLAALGVYQFVINGKWFSALWRKAIGVFAVAYTLGLCLVSQYNFYDEPRYRAAAYIDQHMEVPNRVYAPPYAHAVGLPAPNEGNHRLSGMILLHEAFYFRFVRNFTTPFIVPKKKEQVFHCYWDEGMIEAVQKLVYETGDFKIVKRFSAIEVFPERLLFRSLFGSYEPFNGDLLVLVPRDR